MTNRCVWLVLLAVGAVTAAPPALVRGIYADPGPALDNRPWAGYGEGYEFDGAERHGGQASIRCANPTAAAGRGGGQTVQLNQDRPRPIVVGGWARLVGVSGPADYHCSVYLDLVLQGGESWPMKIAAFDPAKTGWQYAERTYTPPKPIVSARVYVFLRERAGTAWFDDLLLAEVLDEQGTRSPNRLRDPGFETPEGGDPSVRDAFFGKLTELGCNAVHVYRHVAWERVMSERPTDQLGAVPPPDPKDPFLGFVKEAHRRGFAVWVTVGLGLPAIRDTKSPWFPFWPCPNGPWGEGYTRAIAYLAQYGVDGIGMVPDEWNYDTHAVSYWAKHPNAEVARFYGSRPPFCDCPVCHTRFKDQWGLEYPDVKRPWSSADTVWARLARFRYDSTALWLKRSVAAAKQANPKTVTDTMICVLPVCSRDRLYTGAAWDQIGVETGLDCLQTDPYIFLHNYRGDSTHWYPTETMLHLTAANHRAYSGVTLELCRLEERYRDKDPVDVYGAALSCFAQGAREYFWWYYSYTTGQVKFVEPTAPSRQLAAVYKVMQDLDEPVRQARPSGDLLVLYSRASEDLWDLAEHAKALPPRTSGAWPAKRGFLAHRNVLHWLLRRAVPFQMTFLDNPDPARLAAAKVILVPFAAAVEPAQLATLKQAAEAGKTVVLMSDAASLEAGRLAANVATAPLLGPPQQTPGQVTRLGAGQVVYLGPDFAGDLLTTIPPVKDPTAVVPLAPLADAGTATLNALLNRTLGRPASLFAEQPAQDVEAQLLIGPAGRVLLLTNWSLRQPATVRLRLGPGRATGWQIRSDAAVQAVSWQAGGAEHSVTLAPQEARLVRWSAP